MDVALHEDPGTEDAVEIDETTLILPFQGTRKQVDKTKAIA